MLIFLPIFSIAGGMTTLVGMFYGANRIKELNQIIKSSLTEPLATTPIGVIFAVEVNVVEPTDPVAETPFNVATSL